MPASYFKELRDQGYEISIQGCKQGSLTVHDGTVKLFSDINLPDSIVEAAMKAGAEDHRVSLHAIAADMQNNDSIVTKQLNLINAEIEEATTQPENSPRIS
jgi:hypothetical protein